MTPLFFFSFPPSLPAGGLEVAVPLSEQEDSVFFGSAAFEFPFPFPTVGLVV